MLERPKPGAAKGNVRIGKTDAVVLAFHSRETYANMLEGRPSPEMNQALMLTFVERMRMLFPAPLHVLQPKTRVIDLPATDSYELVVAKTRSGKTELLPDYLCAAHVLGRKKTELYELTLIWAQDMPWGFEPKTTSRLQEIPWENGTHVAP